MSMQRFLQRLVKFFNLEKGPDLLCCVFLRFETQSGLYSLNETALHLCGLLTKRRICRNSINILWVLLHPNIVWKQFVYVSHIICIRNDSTLNAVCNQQEVPKRVWILTCSDLFAFVWRWKTWDRSSERDSMHWPSSFLKGQGLSS